MRLVETKSSSSNEKPVTKDTSKAINRDSITTRNDLEQLTSLRHDTAKREWDKNGTVQYKDDYIAILQRMWGAQVQFIIAYSQLTKEGYRLMAIDEGMQGSVSNIAGGVNAYFYFQRKQHIR